MVDESVLRLRSSAGNTMLDSRCGVAVILSRLQAQGMQHIVATGGVGDPFPFLFAKHCAELGLHGHLILRARQGAVHPTATSKLEVQVLSHAEFKLRTYHVGQLLDSLQNVEVVADMSRAFIEYSHLHELCRTMASAWQLCEACYWPTLPPSVANVAVVTPLLVNWYHEHGMYPSVLPLNLTESSEFTAYFDAPKIDNFTSTEEFWNVVCETLVQARLEDVRTLLQADAQSSNETAAIDELIVAMPIMYNKDAGVTFEMEWRGWQTKCRNSKARFNMITGPGRAIYILCGDESVIRNYCREWRDLFIALLFYTRPNARLSELPHMVDHCMAVIPSHSKFDRLVRAIFRRDVYETLTTANEHYPIWFAAHLGNFLHHTTYLDPHPSEYPLFATFTTNCARFFLFIFFNFFVIRRKCEGAFITRLWQ